MSDLGSTIELFLIVLVLIKTVSVLERIATALEKEKQ